MLVLKEIDQEHLFNYLYRICK